MRRLEIWAGIGLWSIESMLTPGPVSIKLDHGDKIPIFLATPIKEIGERRKQFDKSFSWDLNWPRNSEVSEAFGEGCELKPE